MNFSAGIPVQQYLSARSNASTDATESNHLMVDCNVPKLRQDVSQTHTDDMNWVGSQSSYSSQEHSFEIDSALQKELLRAPRVWEKAYTNNAADQAKDIGSIFPEFQECDGAYTTYANGRLQSSANEGPGDIQPNFLFSQMRNTNFVETRELALGGDVAVNSNNLNTIINEKDSFSMKSNNIGRCAQSGTLSSCSRGNYNSNDSSFDCDNYEDENDDLIQFSCTPLTLAEAIAFEDYLSSGNCQQNLPIFGFSAQKENVNAQPVDVPPLCSMLQYMGETIQNLRRERCNSESSDEQEHVMCYQEKKNFEFFFKPRDIQTHIETSIKGEENNSFNLFGQMQSTAESSQLRYQDCNMDIDYDMIPDEDDLMSALMT